MIFIHSTLELEKKTGKNYNFIAEIKIDLNLTRNIEIYTYTYSRSGLVCELAFTGKFGS